MVLVILKYKSVFVNQIATSLWQYHVFLKDFNNAIRNFDIALETFPEGYFIYFERGNAKFELGDNKGACEDWAKAIEFGYRDEKGYLKKKCSKNI